MTAKSTTDSQRVGERERENGKVNESKTLSVIDVIVVATVVLTHATQKV